MSASLYLDSNERVSARKTNFRQVIATILLAFTFLGFAASNVITGQQQTVAAQEDDSFDPIRWVMCLFGDDSMPGIIYQATQTSDIQFALQSKSVISPGVDKVEIGPLGMNWMLDFTGGEFKKVNETILGHPIDPTEKPADGAAAGKFNGGVQVNPFDRFGVAGLNWTSYAGEWKYIIVKACHPGQMSDPKAGLFYENRLVPLSVWEDRENSLDVRTQQHAAGLGTSLLSSFTNLLANMIFNIAKMIIVITISLINFAFTDLVKLMGLDEWLAGTGNNTGMFGKLFTGIFEPFIFVAFTLTGLNILWHGIVKRQFRLAMNVLLRSLALFFIAIIIAAKPAFFIAMPNNVAVGIQALLVTAMNQGLAGGNGMCATDVGSTNKKIITNGAADDVGILEQASKNMRSQIGCSFWQQFLLKPWAEGQYGKDWNKVWAKDKIAGWAPGGAEALNNGPDNVKMVGDATVPLGAEKVINNWAVYQISTQTDAHSDTANPDGYSKYTSGVANDWWRIVDALANYEEETKSAKVGAQGGNEGTIVGENPGSNNSAPTWPTPTKIPLSGNYNGHSGIDIPVPEGTPAIASKDGVVTKLRTDSTTSYGNAIYVKFSDGTEAIYAHLSSFKVAANDTFTQGQTIGLTGNTGNSKGAHLHFEINPAGSVWGNESNRQATISYLNGSSAGGTPTQTGSDIDNNTMVSYNVPKINPKSELWDQWVGNNVFNRLGTATTAVFVAIIGVIAPLFFAFLTAIYALGLGILMAFAPLMLLLGCWAGKGWEIFKSWGELVINTMMKRIAAGVMLVMAMVFSAAAINIMETESWWEGIIFMILLSVILIRSRHKILDAFASIRFASQDFSGSANKLSGKMFGSAKSAGSLALAGAVGAHSSKKMGGGALAGAGAGLKSEFRNIGYRNAAVRSALRYQASAKQMRDSMDKGNPLGTSIDGSTLCVRCFDRLDLHGSASQDDYGNYYCQNCAEEYADELDLTEVLINDDITVEKQEVEVIKVPSAFTRIKEKDMGMEGASHILNSEAFAAKVSEMAAADIHEYKKLKTDHLAVQPPPVPREIADFLDIPLLEEAWKKNEWDYIKNMYAVAWASWAAERYTEGFEDVVNTILVEIEHELNQRDFNEQKEQEE